MTLGVRIDGTWACGLGALGDLSFSSLWSTSGGGLHVLSFALSLPRNFTHPALRRGALVELYAGPLALGAGVMAEPNRDEWTFVVDGLFTEGAHYVAVDALGEASTDISVIVPQAISRGLPWRNPGDLPTGSLSTASEDVSNLNYVSDVLNRYCLDNGKRWWVDAHRYLRIGDDPTSPRWSLAPGTPAMATAEDDYASRMFGRYVSAVSGTPPEPSAWGVEQAADAAAAARWGTREVKEDLTDLGVLTALDAETLLAARLLTEKARPSYTQAVEVGRSQITTLGGTAPELWQPWAGDMVRHFGWLDSDGGLAWGKTVDWVIGSTSYKAGEQTITLGPVGLAPRTTAQVVAAQKAASEVGFQ